MENNIKKPFKPLNEDILDDVFGADSNIDSKSLLLTGKKKGKRKSVLQQVKNQSTQQKPYINNSEVPTGTLNVLPTSTVPQLQNPQQKIKDRVLQPIVQKVPEISLVGQLNIVAPQPIAETQFNNVVQSIQKTQQQNFRKEQIQSTLYLQKSKNQQLKEIVEGNITLETNPEAFQELNKQEIQNYQEITGNQLSEEVNIIELKEEISDAADEIPDANNYDLSDFDIKEIPTKKDKTGYIKTKVSIKKNNMPDVINQIASYIKKQTNGLISPRVMDFRVIGNTNKTQLRGQEIKLSTLSIVFKPDHNKLKVNKGTRFCISVPEDFTSTGNLIVYIQESRAKHIMIIDRSDFDSQAIFNEFIGDRIAEYYTMGFEVMKKKLLFRRIDNPLMKVVNSVVGTGDYLAKPYTDDEGHMYAVDFKSKGINNQWMYVQILESNIKGMYTVTALNRVDSSWKYAITGKSGNNVSLNALLDKLYDILKTLYDKKDWGLGEGEEDYYLADNITYRALKDALYRMCELREEFPNIGIELKRTLSQKETSKAINPEYGAESIIGKTSFVKYFLITYLAYQIIGGDSRKGRQYITRQEYYEKYSVKDRRDYQEREKTILKKEGEQRNYNARPYIFQVEYQVGDNKYMFRCKNIETLFNATGILTEKPTAPNRPSEF